MWSHERLEEIAKRRGEFADMPEPVREALSAFERFRGRTEEDLNERDYDRLEKQFLSLPPALLTPELVDKVPELGELHTYLEDHAPAPEPESPEPSKAPDKASPPGPDRDDERDDDREGDRDDDREDDRENS